MLSRLRQGLRSHLFLRNRGKVCSKGLILFQYLTGPLPVFSFGSAEKGQLGNGITGERITTGNKTAFDIEPSPGKRFSILIS